VGGDFLSHGSKHKFMNSRDSHVAWAEALALLSLACMFGVTLPVPTSWLRTETLRPNLNPSQDFQPISFVAGGLDLLRHIISTPPSTSKASLRKVLFGRLARVHSKSCDRQWFCGYSVLRIWGINMLAWQRLFGW
jgi:hypothetical protein